MGPTLSKQLGNTEFLTDLYILSIQGLNMRIITQMLISIYSIKMLKLPTHYLDGLGINSFVDENPR